MKKSNHAKRHSGCRLSSRRAVSQVNHRARRAEGQRQGADGRAGAVKRRVGQSSTGEADSGSGGNRVDHRQQGRLQRREGNGNRSYERTGRDLQLLRPICSADDERDTAKGNAVGVVVSKGGVGQSCVQGIGVGIVRCRYRVARHLQHSTSAEVA